MFHCGMVGVVFGSCLYLQEYEQGDVETKKQILSNLDKYGVKNCSWVHQLSKSTKTHNAHTEGHCDACFSAVMLLHCMLLAHCLARAGLPSSKLRVWMRALWQMTT